MVDFVNNEQMNEAIKWIAIKTKKLKKNVFSFFEVKTGMKLNDEQRLWAFLENHIFNPKQSQTEIHLNTTMTSSTALSDSHRML